MSPATGPMLRECVRFTSFSLWPRIHHELIFSSSFRLDHLFDYVFELACLEFPVSADELRVGEYPLGKGPVMLNRFGHRHSEPSQHERNESREKSRVQQSEFDNAT
jgi:hypothetical protein